jgi:tetratricopeptide (TPR) repeat protein
MVATDTENDREANPTFAAARHAMAAVGLLEAGKDEQAESELKQALAKEPDNKLALSLKRQLSEDPIKRFGRESFNYTVKSGETLSQIADRFLGDAFLFPALAKYNGIKVPKHVSEGQTLKIPGKTPASALSTESAKKGTGTTSASASGISKNEATTITPASKAFQAAQVSERSGNLVKALDDYKLATVAGHPDGPSKVEFLQKKLSSIHSRAARSALARQNLDAALLEWDQVLQLNPDDETAQLERQKVLRLKDAFQKK